MEEKDKNIPTPAGGISWYLDILENEYKQGNVNSLFMAIIVCLRNDVIAPVWVGDSFLRSLMKWQSYQVKTLDEAFNIRFPKGKRLRDQHKKKVLSGAVFCQVKRLHVVEGNAIDDQLFDKIGEELGIGKTVAKNYYYEYVKNLSARRKTVHEPYNK